MSKLKNSYEAFWVILYYVFFGTVFIMRPDFNNFGFWDKGKHEDYKRMVYSSALTKYPWK